MQNILPYFWLFLLPFAGTLLAQAPTPDDPAEEEELEEPTCVFSGMIWQGASVDGLGYFTEGEKKGDFISIFLPNGGRSRKYAYYGDPPLTFYREVEVEEDDEGKEGPENAPAPDKIEVEEPEEEKKKKIVHVPIAHCNFQPEWKEIFLLLFVSVSEDSDPKYQAHAINFNTTFFPAGTFWFFSRCKQPLSLQFGLDKGQLPPGGQAMIKARLDEFGDLPMRVFEPKGTAQRKIYSTIWNHNPRTRTLVFFLPRPNGVSVRRIVDVVQEEDALGLRPPRDDEKKEQDPFDDSDNRP